MWPTGDGESVLAEQVRRIRDWQPAAGRPWEAVRRNPDAVAGRT